MIMIMDRLIEKRSLKSSLCILFINYIYIIETKSKEVLRMLNINYVAERQTINMIPKFKFPLADKQSEIGE